MARSAAGLMFETIETIDTELLQLLTNAHEDAKEKYQDALKELKKAVSDRAADQDQLALEVEQAKREQAYYKNILLKYLKPFTESDPDVAVVGAKLDVVDLIVSTHSTCHDIHSTILEQQIEPLLPVSRFFEGLQFFAKIFTPIRVAVGGFLAFFDIYKTLVTPQSMSEKGIKITSSLAILALSIVAIAVPAAALIAIGVAMGVGLGREIYTYSKIAHNVKVEEDNLAMLRQALGDLIRKPGRAACDRERFLQAAIDKQEERVKFCKQVRFDARKSLFLNTLGVVGTFLLLPPASLFGIAILTGLLTYNLGRAVGLWSKIANCFSSKKPSSVPASLVGTDSEHDPLRRPLLRSASTPNPQPLSTQGVPGSHHAMLKSFEKHSAANDHHSATSMPDPQLEAIEAREYQPSIGNVPDPYRSPYLGGVARRFELDSMGVPQIPNLEGIPRRSELSSSVPFMVQRRELSNLAPITVQSIESPEGVEDKNSKPRSNLI